MTARILTFIGGLLAVGFATWFVIDVLANGIQEPGRITFIASGIGTLAALLLAWGAAASGRKDVNSSERSISVRGKNSGIISAGDHATNTQTTRKKE